MDPVEQLFADARSLLGRIPDREASELVWLQAALTKSLIMAAASNFEVRLLQLLEQKLRNQLSTPLGNFVTNKTLRRQYHTFFTWHEKNANTFYGLFGPDFAGRMKERIRADAALDDSVRAFLSLGNIRNQLAHNDWATFSLEITLDEVVDQYRRAQGFLGALQNEIA